MADYKPKSDFELALAAQCPYCNAKPGVDCHTPSGERMQGVHNQRLAAYRQFQMDLQPQGVDPSATPMSAEAAVRYTPPAQKRKPRNDFERDVANRADVAAMACGLNATPDQLLFMVQTVLDDVAEQPIGRTDSESDLELLKRLGFRPRYLLCKHPAWPDPLDIWPPTEEHARETFENNPHPDAYVLRKWEGPREVFIAPRREQ